MVRERFAPQERMKSPTRVPFSNTVLVSLVFVYLIFILIIYNISPSVVVLLGLMIIEFSYVL